MAVAKSREGELARIVGKRGRKRADSFDEYARAYCGGFDDDRAAQLRIR